ncbi:ATP-binding protein [Paenibacillus monticola]|uniref:histidine kinase n=1 Tax=Paenibacillus monticola TaxID=2666075 RepID=A0A7X2H5T2_9BACL|nr:ATP-binding protein [Paenibacillus monticola]MRN53975.1 response regulator [Paenibacillus monticola]
MEKILIVEDDQAISDLIQTNLDIAGYASKQVFNGSEALEHINTYAPDLVLLDINMPDQDGFEIMSKLEPGGILVIFLTARNSITDKVKGLKLGADDYIVITLILAVGLYLMIWYLTRSVRSLTKSAQTITRGDYSQRVSVLSNDEIGILAQNFNQMADAVEDKVDELEVLARQRQNFIDYLTHELKTPLTSIIGYADLLRTTKYNEAVYFKALNYIYSEGKRLESLSFKLMDLILVGKEKPILEMEEITPLCVAIEEALKPRLEKSDIELVVSVEPHKLMIEKDLFILLCTNLLDNAMKASTEGSRIFFRGYSDSDRFYVFEVEDEGIGIPEQDVPHIFEPFFMVDKTQSKSHHSAGLGLAICSEIITLHDGKIEITSRLNIGTKVKLLFPISNN